MITMQTAGILGYGSFPRNRQRQKKCFQTHIIKILAKATLWYSNKHHPSFADMLHALRKVLLHD